jgi:hypothetical protein
MNPPHRPYYLFEEQLVLSQLLSSRGRGFLLAMFPDASEDTLARVVYGHDVDETSARYIKKVLKERMTHD